MTTISDEQAAALAALPNQKQRVIYACEAMPATAATLPADVMAWLAAREIVVPRQTTSKHLNAWKDQHNIPRVSTGSTGTQRAITPGTLAAMDAQGFVGTPQKSAPAGLEGSHSMEHATVADFAPSASAPTSPAVSTPPEAVRPVASPSLPPVVSPPRRVAPPSVEPPVRSVASAAVAGDASSPADGADGADQSAEVTVPWSFRGLYAGLLIGAGYGLYEVLHHVAGAPWPIALVAAAAIELVGISIKRLADRGERHGEPRRVVRALLIASGAIAVGIAITNGWGHSQIPASGGGVQAVSAAGYAMMSILGYVIWTVSTALAHRATRRRRGRLEGPGVRIPAYIEERYGRAVVRRAELVSQFDESLTITGAIQRALAELDAEEREANQRARRKALRAVVVKHARSVHKDPLAADLEAARYSDDELSDMVSATAEEHVAKRDELIAWLDADKK